MTLVSGMGFAVPPDLLHVVIHLDAMVRGVHGEAA